MVKTNPNKTQELIENSWLEFMEQILNNNKNTIHLGLEIIQKYLLSTKHKVSINFGRKKNKTAILREWTGKIDKRKQVNAIIPNIIHSLDASHLINLLNTAISEDLNTILPIHGCFGAHLNQMKKLAFLVKVEFVKLYTNNNFF
jgi:DNA-directed RNA polymerase